MVRIFESSFVGNLNRRRSDSLRDQKITKKKIKKLRSKNTTVKKQKKKIAKCKKMTKKSYWKQKILLMSAACRDLRKNTFLTYRKFFVDKNEWRMKFRFFVMQDFDYMSVSRNINNTNRRQTIHQKTTRLRNWLRIIKQVMQTCTKI